MRNFPIAVCAAAAALSLTSVAFATDIMSQDEKEYELTVAMGGENRTVLIASAGELRDVCSETCVISLPDGQSVEVGPSDIVLIVDGEISIQE